MDETRFKEREGLRTEKERLANKMESACLYGCKEKSLCLSLEMPERSSDDYVTGMSEVKSQCLISGYLQSKSGTNSKNKIRWNGDLPVVVLT